MSPVVIYTTLDIEPYRVPMKELRDMRKEGLSFMDLTADIVGVALGAALCTAELR